MVKEKEKKGYVPGGTGSASSGASRKGVLTLVQVERWLEDEDSVDIAKFTAIDEDAAAALGQSEGDWLELDGLTSLSEGAASALGKFKGKKVSLNGLTSLSEGAVAALGKSQGKILYLNGLASLSEGAAAALGQFKGLIIYLNGLKSLTQGAAAVLAKFKGEELSLDGLKSLSADEAAALGRFNPLVVSDGDDCEDKEESAPALKSRRRPTPRLDNKAKSKSKHQGRSLFRLSGTNKALSQTARTVRVCIELSHSEEDPDVVYGRFVGYGGGGVQEEGCFKLIRSANAFFLSRSGEAGRGWDALSESASSYGSEMDEADKSYLTDDISSVMDETQTERTKAAASKAKQVDDDQFEEFAGDQECLVFSPTSLAAMKKGHGGWFRWEGPEDWECLKQISEHWALQTTFS